MFSDAYKKAVVFTQPVIVSMAMATGEVMSSVATFVVINEEGWIMTAAHVMAPLQVMENQRPAYEAYLRRVNEINLDAALSAEARAAEIEKLQVDSSWIRQVSYWWGNDAFRAVDIRANVAKDIAVVRLDGFRPEMFAAYPVFRSRENKLTPGTSLCRLGFPFSEVKSTFDDATGNFTLAPGSLPVPYFPIDGIMTRNFIERDADGNERAHFIEISTPGLRGQSGGPIFDVNGEICGLQSKTQHLPLGFDIKAREGESEVTDRQYLHTGLGLHLDDVTAFLDENGVRYKSAEE